MLEQPLVRRVLPRVDQLSRNGVARMDTVSPASISGTPAGHPFFDFSVEPTALIDIGRGICGDLSQAHSREWLVTNGIGGYAAGTVGGTLSRRYHGILIAALQPPLGR